MYKFIVYTISNCSFCYNTLKLLELLNFESEIIHVPEKQKQEIKIQNEMNTFPQIFLQYEENNLITKEKIGGYDNLSLLLKIVISIQKQNISINVIFFLLGICKKNEDSV